jgi:hypothetical protein
MSSAMMRIVRVDVDKGTKLVDAISAKQGSRGSTFIRSQPHMINSTWIDFCRGVMILNLFRHPMKEKVAFPIFNSDIEYMEINFVPKISTTSSKPQTPSKTKYNVSEPV